MNSSYVSDSLFFTLLLRTQWYSTFAFVLSHECDGSSPLPCVPLRPQADLSSPHVHARVLHNSLFIVVCNTPTVDCCLLTNTLTHPLASLPSVTTYFISSNLSIVVYYIAIHRHPSSPPPTSISNQTETYSFFASTTKAYPLYH